MIWQLHETGLPTSVGIKIFETKIRRPNIHTHRPIFNNGLDHCAKMQKVDSALVDH